MPANLFYGTGIPACILVLDKENATARKGIFMIDASKGFKKDGPKNRLREQDIHKIVDTFTRLDETNPRYARMVPIAEIADPKNDYNLNLPRYIDSTEPEDLQDIDGHLRGGIPERDLDALGHYWKIMPGLRAALFGNSTRPGYAALKLPVAEVKSAIFSHPEFTAFTTTARKLFTTWQTATMARLNSFAQNGHPKPLIETIAEDLLATFKTAPLLDAYDIYQHLMDYWAETMQDDCYLIAADGWLQAAQLRLLVDDKNKKVKAKPDLVVGRKKYSAELIPPALVVARYYSQEQSAIEALEAQVASLGQQLDEIAEEHAVEGGLLEDARNEKDKLTKASAASRLKDIKNDPDGLEEREKLREYLELTQDETDANTKLKSAQETLMARVAARYGTLAEADIQTLVVNDKWLATLAAAVQGELDRVSQTLTGRIRQLAERYATPLPQLIDEVALLAAKVDGHLRKMGAIR